MSPVMINFLCGYRTSVRGAHEEISGRPHGNLRRVVRAQDSERAFLRAVPCCQCSQGQSPLSVSRSGASRAGALADSRRRTRDTEASHGSLARRQSGTSARILAPKRRRARSGEAEGQPAESLAAQARSHQCAERQALHGLRRAIPAVCHALRPPRSGVQAVQHRPAEFPFAISHPGRNREMRPRMRQLSRRAHMGAARSVNRG